MPPLSRFTRLSPTTIPNEFITKETGIRMVAARYDHEGLPPAVAEAMVQIEAGKGDDTAEASDRPTEGGLSCQCD